MSEKSCIFCRIINKELPTEFIHQDEYVFVFRDKNPKAPTHLLVVPRVHIKSFLDINGNQFSMLTKLVKVIQRLVRSQKLQNGYRVMVNGGRHQEIEHLHFHLLGD